MARMFRRVGIVALVFVMLSAVMPAGAWAAVSLTHERNWGSSGTGDGQFYRPKGVATDKMGNVYVVGGDDGDDRVQMFSADGTFVRSVGAIGVPEPDRRHLWSASTSRWGLIHVVESGNTPAQRPGVIVYNPLLHSEWGVYQDPGPVWKLSQPRGIAVGLNGIAYVTQSNKVQRWDVPNFKDEWTVPNTSVMGVSAGHDGDVVIVTDKVGSGITNSVIVYDEQGEPPQALGRGGHERRTAEPSVQRRDRPARQRLRHRVGGSSGPGLHVHGYAAYGLRVGRQR